MHILQGLARGIFAVSRRSTSYLQHFVLIAKTDMMSAISLVQKHAMMISL